MNSGFILKLHQRKGDPNSVRVFCNGEMMDEIDTTTTECSYAYDFKFEWGVLSYIIIEVLNEKTLVDEKNNILSSNSIIIDSIIPSVDGIVPEQDTKCDITFIRKPDPIWQILSSQKNSNYDRVNFHQCESVGLGKFIFLIMPIIGKWGGRGNAKGRFIDTNPFCYHADPDFEMPYTIKENGEKIMKKINFWNSQVNALAKPIDLIIDEQIHRMSQIGKSGNKMWPDNNPDIIEKCKVNMKKALNYYED